MKTVERHKKTDFGDVWYVNAIDGTYRFAVYKYDDDNDTIYLSNVFVKEDSRRQGYGNEILTSAEEYANRLGVSVICLKVLSGSDVHRWYKRHGYEDLEKDEEERGYMWMKKDLKKVNESVWADIHRRSNGIQVRKEDDVNLLSLEEFYEYIKKHYKSKVEYIDLDPMGGGNGDVLGVDITENVILFYKPKRGHILLSWSKVKIPIPFFDELTDRFKIENPNAMRRIITEKDGSCTNKTFIDVIDFFVKHIDDIVLKESVWTDIHKRSNGTQVRKEDELDQDDYDAINDFIFGFATRIVWDNEKESLTRFLEYIDKNPEALDCNIERVKKYVERNWFEGENLSDSLAASVEQEYKEKREGMYESVWSDIHRRSNGTQIRKEDEMSDDDYKCLISMSKMFDHAVKYIDDSDDYYYSDTKDDFIKYIECRKEEEFWGNVTPETYDKLIKFVDEHWGSCKGIKDFMSMYSIDECDGVPGGATPANVGGMGAAYFPGPNGEPGSGDLPSPTGIVYHQVAPYTMFLKQTKKKKKKTKKFRKEDEPCVHSPNAKVYDYVDDFREYVDRTYNNMDRRR